MTRNSSLYDRTDIESPACKSHWQQVLTRRRLHQQGKMPEIARLAVMSVPNREWIRKMGPTSRRHHDHIPQVAEEAWNAIWWLADGLHLLDCKPRISVHTTQSKAGGRTVSGMNMRGARDGDQPCRTAGQISSSPTLAAQLLTFDPDRLVLVRLLDTS